MLVRVMTGHGLILLLLGHLSQRCRIAASNIMIRIIQIRVLLREAVMLTFKVLLLWLTLSKICRSLLVIIQFSFLRKHGSQSRTILLKLTL
nr:MAG TPA: hypothetical protein [Caudoviricetes sp.]